MKPHRNIYQRKVFTIPLFVNRDVSLPWTHYHVYFRRMVTRLLAIVLFIGATSYSVLSQAPDLRCLAVDAAGDVQVTWTPASDSCGVFNKYYIYYSPSIGGPFTLIDSVALWSNTTYLHGGAAADVSSRWYYIEASSGCPNNLSDTLQTMFLSASNTIAGTTNLQWNSLHAPEVPTSTEMYLINREDTVTGLLQLVDSSFQLVGFVDSYTSCDDSTGYQITMVDSSGCISSSNIALLEPDLIPPPPVVIDSVSIDPVTGQIVIGWPSVAADVFGYIISIYNPTGSGGFDTILTIYGTTSYIDVGGLIAPGDSIFIFAIDACGNQIGPTGIGHSVIKLKAEIDTCLGVATLDWTPYYLWSTGVADYDVYVSQNGGPFVYEGTSTGTSYTYAGLIRGTNYCYYVRANDGSLTKSSSSNIICSYADTSDIGPEPFVLTVEARDSVKNLVQWTEDVAWSSNLIAEYNIYRNFDGGNYSLIGSVPFGTTMFEDLLEPLTDFINGEGVFCYYVVPVKVSQNLYGCVSTSDTICVTQFPKFVVPNTFSPNGDGRNDVFIPIKSFVKESGFLMMIYTRWGQKLYESTDVNEGWDGIIKGMPAQIDAYVYYVTFLIKDNVRVTRAGTVLLLR